MERRIPTIDEYINESYVGDYTYIGYVDKRKVKSSSHKNYDGDSMESVLNDILKFSEIKKITIGWNESTGSYDVFCGVASGDIEKGKKTEFSYKWKTDTDEELTEYVKKANVYDLEDFINIVYPKIKNWEIDIFY